jgi:hypothetical protein
VRILLALLALPLLLLACALVAYRVPMPASLSGSRDLVAAVAAGIAGIGYLLGLGAYLLGSLRRSARALDPILEPLGLIGGPYAGFGRRYTGVLEGQEVEVRYLPAHRLQPARLDLAVEAEIGVRMAVGRQRPLLDCRDCPRLALGDEFPYRVYARDEHAARRLLSGTAPRRALDRLMDVPGAPTLYIQPGQAWLRARPWRTAALPREAGPEIDGWLRALVRLASR